MLFATVNLSDSRTLIQSMNLSDSDGLFKIDEFVIMFIVSPFYVRS
jgi:hypothetical protein